MDKYFDRFLLAYLLRGFIPTYLYSLEKLEVKFGHVIVTYIICDLFIGVWWRNG